MLDKDSLRVKVEMLEPDIDISFQLPNPNLLTIFIKG
jgi:hypothetical protein